MLVAIERIDGVDDITWSTLQGVWPVHICHGERVQGKRELTTLEFDYPVEEYEVLVYGAGVPFVLLIDKGKHEEIYFQRGIRPSYHRKQHAAFADFQRAGQVYLQKYAIWWQAETARLAKATRQAQDDRDWWDYGKPNG